MPSAAVAAPNLASEGATRWVSIVDMGDYGQSWSDAGAMFKAHVAQADWAGKIKPTRQPLGAVVSRKLKSEQQTTTLPGAPDGRYTVVQFDTQFANKRNAVETVVLADEPTGWKVDGYFIR